MPTRRLIVAPRARFEIRLIAARILETFGRTTARNYEQLIRQAFRDVGEDPTRAAARRFDDEDPPLWAYHLTYSRPRTSALQRIGQPRHLLIYSFDEHSVEILRVLYDAMDLRKHVRGD
jgi:toxin ParE1/3/4